MLWEGAAMAVEYVPIAEDEGDNSIEVPTESDGTLLLSTLEAQFPGVAGLRYRHPDSNALRAVRLTDGALHKPPELSSWCHNGNIVYVCTFPKDGKRGEGDDARSRRKRCTDLIVLGLPYKVTEEDLKDHFSRFGDVVMSQIKRDQQGGSKGYGFIRFNDYDAQIECLSTPRHHIQGRWCETKVPISQGEAPPQTSVPRRVFVGRVTEELTASVLKEFFGQYGTVEEVYIPKPFRAFAFVTFSDAGVADRLINEDFVINNVSVHVGSANPKHSAQINMMRGGPKGHYMQQGGGPMHHRRNWQHMGHQQGNNPYQEVVNALASNPQVLAAALAQVSSMGNMPDGGGGRYNHHQHHHQRGANGSGGGGNAGGGGNDGANSGAAAGNQPPPQNNAAPAPVAAGVAPNANSGGNYMW